MRCLTTILLLFSTFSVLAGYKEKYMEPWIGATQEELTKKWGYPQTANDVVKIDDETTVFTYRSNNVGWGGRIKCLVSFTIKKKVVTRFKYEGGHCPKIRRRK